MAAAARAVEAAGGADVLVNAAAILRPGALDSVATADWSAMLAVNLTGYLTAAQAFGRAMLERGRQQVELNGQASREFMARNQAYVNAQQARIDAMPNPVYTGTTKTFSA